MVALLLVIPRYVGIVPEPKGGVRGVVPGKGALKEYWSRIPGHVGRVTKFTNKTLLP